MSAHLIAIFRCDSPNCDCSLTSDEMQSELRAKQVVHTEAIKLGWTFHAGGHENRQIVMRCRCCSAVPHQPSIASKP
jgi:hypothetical protein